ncbi:MAG TPA: UdgX family uracil-DNA binding protein [Candidatus Limnocylindrales bacterium]|nr:UdgX family uracil-DNA binding protein [Candidatus Limnocylindrales bacterium]
MDPEEQQHEPYARSAGPLVPDRPSLASLRRAAASCDACHLHLHAAQTVFGEGRREAQLMLVGEQPGDREDIAGQPFVGPAGRILDAALEAAGVERRLVYVTNVVKHFKWRRDPRGLKRRLHEKPNRAEVAACWPWLEAEAAVVRPRLIVALGATAAQALLGASFRVTRDRGRFFAGDLAPFVMATVHPSSILRAPDERAREREMAGLVADLRAAAARLAELAGESG